MEFKDCDDTITKAEKRWCGPSKHPKLNKFIPQYFPCACKKHDDKYYNLTLKQADLINKKFFLRMILTTKRTKKWYSKPYYYLMAFVFYGSVHVGMYYYVFKWRKLEK